MAIRRKKVTSPRPPEEYSPAEAARDAQRIADSMTLSKAPLDVEGLAASIGIKVVRQILPEHVSGFLKKSADTWMIGVNANHHPRRQRFTIAHELGHYFLHRHKGEFHDETLFRSNAASNPDEWDANRFAAMILMSAEAILPLIAANTPIGVIAERFGVSELAANFRVQNITDERIAI